MGEDFTAQLAEAWASWESGDPPLELLYSYLAGRWPRLEWRLVPVRLACRSQVCVQMYVAGRPETEGGFMLSYQPRLAVSEVRHRIEQLLWEWATGAFAVLLGTKVTPKGNEMLNTYTFESYKAEDVPAMTKGEDVMREYTLRETASSTDGSRPIAASVGELRELAEKLAAILGVSGMVRPEDKVPPATSSLLQLLNGMERDLHITADLLRAATGAVVEIRDRLGGAGKEKPLDNKAEV